MSRISFYLFRGSGRLLLPGFMVQIPLSCNNDFSIIMEIW